MCKHDITRTEVAEESRITPYGIEAKVCEDCKQVLEVY